MTKVQCEYTVTREVAGLKLNRQQVWKQKQKNPTVLTLPGSLSQVTWTLDQKWNRGIINIIIDTCYFLTITS